MNDTPESRPAAWQRRPGADNWQAENGKACDDAFALRLQAAALYCRAPRETMPQPTQETTTHE